VLKLGSKSSICKLPIDHRLHRWSQEAVQLVAGRLHLFYTITCYLRLLQPYGILLMRLLS
jgi:hypothetical protein